MLRHGRGRCEINSWERGRTVAQYPSGFLKMNEGVPMADGEEERKEQQKRRELETYREREDRVERDQVDPWEPERDES